MNHLIAKIRKQGSRNPQYKKLLSGETLYTLPDGLQQCVDYSPDHNLDEDSWFGIPVFSNKDYCLDFLKTDFNSADHEAMTVIENDKIDFLCSVQDDNKYFFQKVAKSQLVTKKILYISDAFRYEENSKALVIKDTADAIYLKDKDILYFKRLTAITSIFKGIDVLYREATTAETATFLQQSFIRLGNGFSTDDVKQPNRKRIAMAIDTFNAFNAKQKKDIFVYIKNYCPELQFKNNSFEINSDDNLKYLLYGIEQRYYTTQINEERRLANSIVKLPLEQAHE
ncbi:hypothetical protein FACS1894137_09970 [Spirochaetia bacterium]|nr:hypothetical protein FACS1894137_09970 [Spirochaetia bacterium]